MKSNVGKIDMTARFVLAGILVLFAVAFTSSPVLEMLAYFIAALAVLTGLMMFCPLYRLLHIDTSNS